MDGSTNLRLPIDAASPLQTGLKEASRDARALRILAKTIYRELRQGGLAEEDMMFLAGELLSLVTTDVKDRRRNQAESTAVAASPIAPPAR
jgi:hypothetical protein